MQCMNPPTRADRNTIKRHQAAAIVFRSARVGGFKPHLFTNRILSNNNRSSFFSFSFALLFSFQYRQA